MICSMQTSYLLRYDNGIEASPLHHRRRRRRAHHPRGGAAWHCAAAAQPAIKAIEQDIKVQLFRRVPRGVELTDAGRTFLDGARATFANLDRTLESARRTARGEEGQISVAFTSSTAFHPLVPRVIREFREAFPLVTVTLAQGNAYRLDRTASKAIDSTPLSAGDTSSNWRDSSSIHCWRNRWWWLCPRAMRSPGARARAVSVESDFPTRHSL